MRKVLSNAERQTRFRATKGALSNRSTKSSFHQPRTSAERQRLYKANEKLRLKNTETQEEEFTQTQEEQYVQHLVKEC
ncbi:hypothetical protein D910_00553 [Dendroctonus ponderosae]|uniref:Uncharacterized protein n=1 Tax=Dendroctonus ponderosae TaxID=77166 RepID=U4US16_DENPD|nr:hypothetical protein D910_00553 [Dendroctonus ponderosae]